MKNNRLLLQVPREAFQPYQQSNPISFTLAHKTHLQDRLKCLAAIRQYKCVAISNW